MASDLQLNVKIEPPYLVMIGDTREKTYAKTGFGLVQWCPDRVAGPFRFAHCPIDLGVPDLTIDQAAAQGVRSLVIGVAPIGGVIPDRWWTVINEAASAGLDIVCGLHIRLGDREELLNIARQSGSRLIDVRNPPRGIPVGTGKKRSGKKRTSR